MKARAFDVYLGDLCIDTVFWDEETPAKEVRTSLINHDCYPAAISVYRRHPGRYAYDDVARVTHPEELI